MKTVLTAFASKGKFTTLGEDCYQITSCYVDIHEGFATFFSCSPDGVLCSKAYLDVVSDDECSEVLITNLDLFLKDLKEMHEKLTTVIIDDESIKVDDGVTEFGGGISNVTETKVLLSRALSWVNCNRFEDDTIVFQFETNTYKYTPWFAVKDTSIFPKISAAALKRSEINDVQFKTEGGTLSIFGNDPTFKKTFNFRVPAETFKDTECTIKYIFPILNSCSGPVTVYYYTQSNGTLRFWISGEDNEWMLVTG